MGIYRRCLGDLEGNYGLWKDFYLEMIGICRELWGIQTDLSGYNWEDIWNVPCGNQT